ncbi:MAG: hypothetical protein JWQ27_757 [Ferruginibacter sp.]|nr:hypothetical protein [Ferruginibacter sp.]
MPRSQRGENLFSIYQAIFMNVIYCSAKLAKLLGIKSKAAQADGIAGTALGSWNAHLFYFDRKKFIIFMNKRSIYSVTICNYKKTDLLTLKLLFLKALKDQCMYDGISIEEEQLRHHFSGFHFSLTDNDKSAIGSLNDLVYQAQASLAAGPPALQYLDDEATVFNMNSAPYGPINYQSAANVFAELLKST